MKRYLFISGVLILAVLALLLACRIYVEVWSERPLSVQSIEVVSVPSGSSLYQLSSQLEQAGMIDSARLFRLYGRLHAGKGQIMAGDYQITPGLTAADLYDKLDRGEVIQYSVTLVDGQTFASFCATLAKTPKLVSTLGQQDIGQLLKSWGSEHSHPEGLFFPDTYTYQNGDTDVSVLLRAYQRMQQQLQTAWANRAEGLPYRSAYEALVMASIIEKETGVAAERGQIAGVFVNRLRLNMRLQTDPTVIYGMGDRYEGNIRKTDLNELTPYNTYRIDGLPPTPIANPGMAAIDAALHPAPTDALYFVAKGDGSHQFSVTLADHEKAVREFQKKRRTDYRSAPGT